MRTARQPTIKTLLLLTAVVAVLCAFFPKEFLNERWDRYALIGLLSEILFWAVSPLVVGIYCRSARLAAAIYFGVGCLVNILFLLGRGFGRHVSEITLSIIAGPFGPPVMISRALKIDGPILLVEVLIGCTVVSFLVAKSCRLREQPGQSA